MCGIVGYLNKGRVRRPLGEIVLAMLEALGCRGPDSAGMALWSGRISEAIKETRSGAIAAGDSGKLWIKVREKHGEEGGAQTAGAAQAVLAAIAVLGKTIDVSHRGAYLRVELRCDKGPQEIVRRIEAVSPAVEVVSFGSYLELVKQVGSPRALEETYNLKAFRGTHGIGHTRLSTESRVDLSHSQPFWAHGLPDVATVHNGHLTNYHKMRRCYEQRGYRFYTENDSELIGVYLHDQLAQGRSLEETLHRSVWDFDGSFCYLVGTENGLGFVKDCFGLKPLVVAETEDFIAVATEEIALRTAFGDGFIAEEPPPGEVRFWNLAALSVG